MSLAHVHWYLDKCSCRSTHGMFQQQFYCISRAAGHCLLSHRPEKAWGVLLLYIMRPLPSSYPRTINIRMEMSSHAIKIVYLTRPCSSHNECMDASLLAKKGKRQRSPQRETKHDHRLGERRFRDKGDGGGGGRFPSRRTDTRAVGLTRMSFRTCDLHCTASQWKIQAGQARGR